MLCEPHATTPIVVTAMKKVLLFLVPILLVTVACQSMPKETFQFTGPVSQLRIMTFNVWESGSRVHDGRNKIVAAIRASGADVVTMQESGGAAGFVARTLGWYSYQPSRSVAIVSRYPIMDTYGPTHNHAGAGARIMLNDEPRQEIVAWSVYLSSRPYAPLQACLEGAETEDILAGQARNQLRDISSILAALAAHVSDADKTPVFLAGDLNTPSHLDWSPAAAELHCGYAVPYPVTQKIEAAGLTDAYRQASPDPVADPANTWSPIYETYVYPIGTPEPMDRIDMIFFTPASAQVTDANTFVIGEPAQSPDHKGNQWPSDHKAVIADFVLK